MATIYLERRASARPQGLSYQTPIRHSIFVLLSFYVLKPRCSEAEQKAWARMPCGTLFERPNVRVRAAAVNMFFVRAAEGRVAGRH